MGRTVGHLGPHAVGTRVVVRRLVPGETGPTGGPAFTDVLGVLEGWDAPGGDAVVRREDGVLVSFPTALVVSGKPVPARPSRFSRLSPEHVLRYAEAGFRRLDSVRVGDWELRYVGGANPRANAALLVGDPGIPLDDALAEVRAFAARHDRAPVAEVVDGSVLHAALLARGWQPLAGPGDVLVAGVASLSRGLRDVDTAAVRHESALTPEWLVGNDRALANYAVVATTLELPDQVFASLHDEQGQRGRVRANVVDDWAFVADVAVAPRARRQGVARTLMADVVAWAAERGASAIVLDAGRGNEPAQGLYRGLGFEHHHAFQLLEAPRA